MAWVATRVPLYLLATGDWKTSSLGPYQGNIIDYQRWYAHYLSHGVFPAHDQQWQYPPGVAAVFWVPAHLPGGYLRGFVLFTLLADLVILLALARRARAGGSWQGCLYWLVAVPLFGPVALTRYDVVPTALAVVALLMTGSGTCRGILAGVGAAIKVWPAVLLVGTPPGQWRRTLAAAVAAGGALTLGYVVFATNATSFLSFQKARGLEIEAIAATPFLVWRHFGWGGSVTYHYGALQLAGPGTRLAVGASLLLTAAAIAGLAAWRLLIARGRLAWDAEFATDASLTATLLIVVTSKVLSAEYMVWLVGVAACCLAAGKTSQRGVAVLILIAAGLTQVLYPFQFNDLIRGADPATSVTVLRNLVLLAATAGSCWLLVRASLNSRNAAVDARALPVRRVSA